MHCRLLCHRCDVSKAGPKGSAAGDAERGDAWVWQFPNSAVVIRLHDGLIAAGYWNRHLTSQTVIGQALPQNLALHATASLVSYTITHVHEQLVTSCLKLL
jgi:hypothetical protein